MLQHVDAWNTWFQAARYASTQSPAFGLELLTQCEQLATGTLERSDTLTFRTETWIVYADENDPAQNAATSTPTKFKKVILKVYSLDLPDADTVRVSQSISCKDACSW